MKWRVEDKWVPIEIEREAIGAKLSFQGELLRIEEEEGGFWVSDSVVLLFLSCYSKLHGMGFGGRSGNGSGSSDFFLVLGLWVNLDMVMASWDMRFAILLWLCLWVTEKLFAEGNGH